MASRHQRRKRARAKAIAMQNRTTEQKFSDFVAETVKRNLAQPKPERSFAPSSVALVQQSNLGTSGRFKQRTLPYTKHRAGAIPLGASYDIDTRIMTATERRLRSERSQDFKLEAPAVNYPIVERDA